MKRDPYLIIEWSDRFTNAKGWLVIDTIVDGYAGGGIRMVPTVTKEEVIRLAQVMTHKGVAAQSETGGAKAGIKYDCHKDDAYEVLKRFMAAIKPYVENGVVVGEDLGTSYEDIISISRELEIGPSMPKHHRENPKVQEGMKNLDVMLGEYVEGLDFNRVITGYGVAMATDEAWKYLKGKKDAKIAIQGFGSVGGSAALWLTKQGYKVIAISDINGTYYNEEGLNVKDLLNARNRLGELNGDKVTSKFEIKSRESWLETDADIIIPAAIEGAIDEKNASKIQASLIVEGANIPTTLAGDKILREKEIRLVPDFIANLGAACFFDSVEFSKCPATPKAVMDRVNELIRDDVRKTFEKADTDKIYERDAAIKLFSPN